MIKEAFYSLLLSCFIRCKLFINVSLTWHRSLFYFLVQIYNFALSPKTMNFVSGRIVHFLSIERKSWERPSGKNEIFYLIRKGIDGIILVIPFIYVNVAYIKQSLSFLSPITRFAFSPIVLWTVISVISNFRMTEN